jgi:hypothetical protein
VVVPRRVIGNSKNYKKIVLDAALGQWMENFRLKRAISLHHTAMRKAYFESFILRLTYTD